MDNTAPGVATENATRVNSRDAEKNSKEKLRESGIEKGNDIGVTTRTAPATADNTTIGDNADDIARQKSLDTDVEKQGLSAADDEQWLTGKKTLVGAYGFPLSCILFRTRPDYCRDCPPKVGVRVSSARSADMGRLCIFPYPSRPDARARPSFDHLSLQMGLPHLHPHIRSRVPHLWCRTEHERPDLWPGVSGNWRLGNVHFHPYHLCTDCQA